MTAPVLKRSAPKPPGQAQLTHRDRLVVLPAIGRLRPVSSSQIRRYAGFPSADTCARRLRVLRDKKLVAVHTPWGPSGENLYTLTTQGMREIERLGDFDEADLMRVTRSLGGDLDHHVAVVDAFVDATVGAARSTRLRLVRAVLDWELRAAGASTSALVPDLVLVVAGPTGERAFAVEVDRGTISPRKIADKARLYAALLRDGRGLLGVTDWRVLVQAPSRRRMNRLADALLDVNLPDHFWSYGVEGEVDDRTFFTNVWHTVVATGEDTAGFRLVNPFDAEDRGTQAGSSLAVETPPTSLPGSPTDRRPS